MVRILGPEPADHQQLLHYGTSSHVVERHTTIYQRGYTKMSEPVRDAYECPDGWFEVRDDAGPHRWIATRDPITVER